MATRLRWCINRAQRLTKDTTHLVLSVGGNDALGCIQRLDLPAATVKQGLIYLTMIQASFRASYEGVDSYAV
jgi:lysophospholipase L1-like esterase